MIRLSNLIYGLKLNITFQRFYFNSLPFCMNERARGSVLFHALLTVGMPETEFQQISFNVDEDLSFPAQQKNMQLSRRISSKK